MALPEGPLKLADSFKADEILRKITNSFENEEEIRAIVLAQCGEHGVISPKYFGYWLRSLHQAVHTLDDGDYCIVIAVQSDHGNRWKLEKLEKLEKPSKMRSRTVEVGKEAPEPPPSNGASNDLPTARNPARKQRTASR
jgi:hypothetical protein